MKKLATFTAVAAVAAFGLLFLAGNASAGDNQPTNLKLIMHMDEAIVGSTPDDSGNGNDGTLTNGAAIVAGAGEFDGGLVLDGMNDHVTVIDSASLEPAEFTLEAWIKTMASGAFNRIIVKLNGEGRQAYSLAVDTNGKAELRMQAAGGGTDFVTSMTSVNDGSSHHVAGTFDGTDLRIYVDGNLETTVASTTTVPFYSDPGDLFIGSFDGLNQFFDGDIDEVRLWSRVLSNPEIGLSFAMGGQGVDQIDQRPSQFTEFLFTRKWDIPAVPSDDTTLNLDFIVLFADDTDVLTNPTDFSCDNHIVDVDARDGDFTCTFLNANTLNIDVKVFDKTDGADIRAEFVFGEREQGVEWRVRDND